MTRSAKWSITQSPNSECCKLRSHRSAAAIGYVSLRSQLTCRSYFCDSCLFFISLCLVASTGLLESSQLPDDQKAYKACLDGHFALSGAQLIELIALILHDTPINAMFCSDSLGSVSSRFLIVALHVQPAAPDHQADIDCVAFSFLTCYLSDSTVAMTRFLSSRIANGGQIVFPTSALTLLC